MNNILQIRHLTITRGQQTLCHDLSLTIELGDCWAVLGPNGSGKTTFLHTLSGHLVPQQGRLLLNNQPLSGLARRDIAKQIGILFQDSSYHFPQSVLEYCLAARFPHQSPFTTRHSNTDHAIMHKALATMELMHLAQKNIQHLSGGEQRRAAIAALLIQSPTFFLLDEPANHLDLHHQIHMMHVFAKLVQTRQHAVIMSLHDINLAARFCNKILMLFPDGTTLHGHRDDILNTEYLSKLYQHPIDVVHANAQTYWLPRHDRHRIEFQSESY